MGARPWQHQEKEPPSSSSQGHGVGTELPGTRSGDERQWSSKEMELARAQQSRLSTPQTWLCWPRHPQSTRAPPWAQPSTGSNDFQGLSILLVLPCPFPGQPTVPRVPIPVHGLCSVVRPTPSRLTVITNISPAEAKSQIQQPLNQHSNPSELAFGGQLANHLPQSVCACYIPSPDTLIKACCACPYTFIKSLFSPSALAGAWLLFSLHREFSLTLAGECLCVCNQKKWERKCSKIDSGAQSSRDAQMCF